MQEKQFIRIIAAAYSVIAAGSASASGFQLLEQNASGLGNAYAGSAVVAENASTIFFNPAGMTQLKITEMSAGFTPVFSSFEYTDNGLFPSPISGNGGDAGGLAFIPNGYLSHAINNDFYLGIGLSAPFGLKTEYDRPWVGAAQSLMFDIRTINLNPSIAYRVNDKLSLGAGLNAMYMEAEYQRLFTTNNLSPLVILKADDFGYGWNIGGLFKLSDSTSLGISYRSSVEQNLEGTLQIGAAVLGAKADIELPDTTILSIKHQLNPDWQLLGDVSRTGWSSVDRVSIIRTDTGATAQTLEPLFRDTWRIALGATQQYSQNWKIKYGVAYDQTPVKNPATRLVSLPDNNRVWLSFGGQWLPSKNSALDLGFSYLFIKDSRIDNDQSTEVPSRGRVNGTYEGNVVILGLQYSMAF